MEWSELLDRVRDAVEKGQQTFWQVIAECFPEATSGDFGPEATLALEMSLVLAVLEWTRHNLPARTNSAAQLVVSASPTALSDQQWREEVSQSWLANDQTRLAELLAMVEEDSHGG